MVSSDQSEQSKNDVEDSPAEPDEFEPRIIRLRLVPWDVTLFLVLSAVLLYLTTMTSWTERLFAFTDNACVTDDCPPVPFMVNYYIFPLKWGGIGGAVTASILGPVMSLLKGWFLCFWPIVAVGVLTLASVLGYAVSGYCQQYWH